jgi:hypothetical protein
VLCNESQHRAIEHFPLLQASRLTPPRSGLERGVLWPYHRSRPAGRIDAIGGLADVSAN